jgi:hypothetical protein
MTFSPELTKAGDRERTIAGMVIARAWRDPEYRDFVRRDPKAALAAEGCEIPADVDLLVMEETATTRYIILAPEATYTDHLQALVRHAIPEQEGHEVRLLRATAGTLYLVLPAPLPDSAMELMSEAQIIRDVAATSILVAVNAEAELSVTTTTDLAEAEAVAVVVLT